MTTIRAATYNVEFGHAPSPHARMIMDRFEHEQIDILAMQEVNDYLPALKKICKPHQLIYSRKGRGANHVAFLIRDGIKTGDGIKIGKHWSFRAGVWYKSTDGHPMAPARPLAVRAAGATFLTLHAPVHAWVAGPHGHTFTGPRLRRIAYQTFIARLRLFVWRNRKTPIVMLGDWNATPPPNTMGAWSPAYLASSIGGRFVRPFASTGHGEIDYAITRGMDSLGCHVRVAPPNLPRSDHSLVVADLTY